MDTLFRTMFGLGDGYEIIFNANDSLGMFIFIVYLILVPLIMINLLIAMIRCRSRPH